MRFYNWQEMYDILAAGTELYNPRLEKHVRCEKGKETLLVSDVKKRKDCRLYTCSTYRKSKKH